MGTAVIILGHGSRRQSAAGSIFALIDAVRKSGSGDIVEQAFLQYTAPDLAESVARCVARGAARIVVVPFFVQSGAHVAADIPEKVAEARKAHPGIEIVVTDHVGAHPLMAKIVEDLVGKAERERQGRSKP